MPSRQLQQRRSGVLLHPTSLPSHTFEDAVPWLEFMTEAGLSVWQVLPLEPPQHGLSPYTCSSAFAINPALLGNPQPLDIKDENFRQFCAKQKHWLDDYALFVVLQQGFEGKPWYEWPDIYRLRDLAMLETLKKARGDELIKIEWEQYLLYSEWKNVHRLATEKNIQLFGDIPLFVALDSADVWANPELFKLDEADMPTVVAGVPPDYFSEDGQRWGNPHYDWEKMQQTDFEWWLRRIEYHFELFDLMRIDHFRGLSAVWEIDADSETAVNGHWVETPGEALLTTVQKKLGELPLVAEDLGIITEEVKALKEAFDLPGMSVLQFSFDGFEDNPHKPQNISPNTVCYTGTHDNDTTLGWYQSLDEEAQQFVRQTLHMNDDDDIVEHIIDTALNSAANMAIIPLQDFFNLDSTARMNTPGTIDHNWEWSFSWDQIPNPKLTQNIRKRIQASDRIIHHE